MQGGWGGWRPAQRTWADKLWKGRNLYAAGVGHLALEPHRLFLFLSHLGGISPSVLPALFQDSVDRTNIPKKFGNRSNDDPSTWIHIASLARWAAVGSVVLAQ